jgi:hypothetical protein
MVAERRRAVWVGRIRQASHGVADIRLARLGPCSHYLHRRIGLYIGGINDGNTGSAIAHCQ